MNNNAQDPVSLEIELRRQEAVNAMIAEYGPEWAEQYVPGTFGCHELLDRVICAAETVEEYVLSHPACAQNRAWYALAEHAVTTLNQLYEKISAEHLEEDAAPPP